MRAVLALLFILSGCGTAHAFPMVPPKAKFYLVGQIDDEVVPYVAEYLSENADAEIVLSTPGGSRPASDRISEFITKHGNVRCVVRDQAMSGGFGILQACRLRVMHRSAVLGTHEPRMAIGSLIERETAALILIALTQSSHEWNARCRARLKISAAEYESRVRGKDWILTSQEAILVGAVDQVIP